ncbi:MAG: hypothetical protein AAB631_00435 [Patescibacteria group bacterium]
MYPLHDFFVDCKKTGFIFVYESFEEALDQFQKIRTSLDRFQAPDGTYKVAPCPYLPDQMDEVMDDMTASVLMLDICSLIEKDPKDGLTEKPFDLRLPFDALVRRFIYSNMWLGNEEIGHKLVQKAVRYLKLRLAFQPFASQLNDLYAGSIENLDAIPIVQ